VRVLNLGGGFGVPYHPEQPRLNLSEVSNTLIEFKSQIILTHPDLKFMIEPGNNYPPHRTRKIEIENENGNVSLFFLFDYQLCFLFGLCFVVD
jgi:hypothetical protein